MYLRAKKRKVKGRYGEYALDFAIVESVRTPNGPRQKVVKYLGGTSALGSLTGVDVIRAAVPKIQEVVKDPEAVKEMVRKMWKALLLDA